MSHQEHDARRNLVARADQLFLYSQYTGRYVQKETTANEGTDVEVRIKSKKCTVGLHHAKKKDPQYRFFATVCNVQLIPFLLRRAWIFFIKTCFR